MYRANVDVEWLDGRIETYRVGGYTNRYGGYANRYEAVVVKGGVLSLWIGNSPFGTPEHVAGIPLAGVRTWKIREES